jgi:2-methylisocitrate lyase-like PEP mutase family enzyme
MTAGAALRACLARPGILVAPGAYDALSARLAAAAGAEAVYMTGFGVAGSLLGAPDIGLVSATEMADRVRALAEAAGPVPLIADGDNGHGGPRNAARLVRLYEGAGAACIQIEDQVFPKRCGHLAGKEIVPLAEAVARLKAAAGARSGPDFLVMARTDARAVAGLDEALRRGEAFLRAGADILFVEAPESVDEMERVARTFAGVPLVANMVEGGRSPDLDARALAEIGFKIALFPVTALLSVAATLETVYRGLLADGRAPADVPRLGFSDYNRAVGLDALLALDAEDSSG